MKKTLAKISKSDFGHIGLFFCIISMLLLTNFAIILDIPYLRQILGFLFITVLPGLLILLILKLNKIGSTEKFVLSIGLSVTFLMFFGLLMNNLSLGLGYVTPLSPIPLLISFDIAFVVLAIIGHKINKNPIFSLPNLNLTKSEKAFLIVPILFPALSIFGMHVMNTTDNNIVLMLLLFSISIYVIFVCIFNQKFPKGIYPVVIFSISLSLIFLMTLRSDHLIGIDTHKEYYFFLVTLNNLHWSIFGYATLNSCLCISLLPTIYQSLLNVPSELIFKVLCILPFSITPLAIYILSKKYVGDSYAFLASFFFMSQSVFLRAAAQIRTSIALMFFALALMVIYNDKLDPVKKRVLFFVFVAVCIVSHYATTYIVFFILLATFVGVELFLRKYTSKKIVSMTFMVLFFAMIFLWYSQVTGAPFISGVDFVHTSLSTLNNMFVDELRSEPVVDLFGEKVSQGGIHYSIFFFFTWMTFAYVGIGIITLIIRYKEMILPERDFKKLDFLKQKFEVEYAMLALTLTGLLVLVVLIPYLTVGYDVGRPYAVATVILSTFFVIGGIVLSKQAFRKSLNKKLSFRKKALLKKQKKKRKISIGEGNRNASEVQAYFVILLVLLPYFLCTTGAMYQMFGVPCSIALNSEGQEYNILYIHNQDASAGEWSGKKLIESQQIYAADMGGEFILRSYAGIYKPKVSLPKPRITDGYIYLRYLNVVNGKISNKVGELCNMTNHSKIFIVNDRIYDNGGSEVWKLRKQ